MCGPHMIIFSYQNIKPEHIKGKRVLEVGSFDVNGSVKELIELHNPKEYIGTDIKAGNNVDQVVSVYDLVKTFGENSFDLIICTEVMEHIKDWRLAIFNMLTVLKKDGYLLITTPSIGFPYHGYPYDYWRYEPEDYKFIFGNQDILACNKSSNGVGTRVYVRKLVDVDAMYVRALWQYRLFSVLTGKRKLCFDKSDYLSFRMIFRIVPFLFMRQLLILYNKLFKIS